MPTWFRETLDYIAQEGRVIRGAPVAFGAFVVLAAFLLWAALSWKFDAQIDSRDSIIASRDATIKFKDGLISEYKSRVQLPDPGEERQLTPDQRRILAHELTLKKDEFKRLVIMYVDEPEPKHYAKQFADISSTIDLPIVQRALPPAVMDVGIYVLVNDTTKPSDAAKDFLEALTRAYLTAHYYSRTVPSVSEEGDSTFALYIAKTPW